MSVTTGMTDSLSKLELQHVGVSWTILERGFIRFGSVGRFE